MLEIALHQVRPAVAQSMTNDLIKRMPWEPVPTEETLALLQKDVAFMVLHSAVLVHSNRPELQILVNVRRGEIVPRNECKFTDGTTLEFQDIGMPQPNMPLMTVKDLLAMVWDVVQTLGLEMVP